MDSLEVRIVPCVDLGDEEPETAEEPDAVEEPDVIEEDVDDLDTPADVPDDDDPLEEDAAEDEG
jgi:hypothetical protein